MVGHTGASTPTIAAVETLDGCLGRIITALEGGGRARIVTADHGNAEQMWDDELKAPHTAHTSNPVPVVLCADELVGRRLRDGSLRDVAPTMLGLLGIPLSAEMTGQQPDRVGNLPEKRTGRPADAGGPCLFIAPLRRRRIIRLLFPAFRRRQSAASAGSACRWR